MMTKIIITENNILIALTLLYLVIVIVGFFS